MCITCFVEFSENPNFKKGRVYQVEEFSSLNSLTNRLCLTFEEKRGYDKVYFEFQVDGETFYYCKYYVISNGNNLFTHLMEMIPQVVDDKEEQHRLIDLFEMCFSVSEYSQDKVDESFKIKKQC